MTIGGKIAKLEVIDLIDDAILDWSAGDNIIARALADGFEKNEKKNKTTSVHRLERLRGQKCVRVSSFKLIIKLIIIYLPTFLHL